MVPSITETVVEPQKRIGEKRSTRYREKVGQQMRIFRRAKAKQLAAREDIRRQEDGECKVLTSHGYESLQNSYDVCYSILLPARVTMVELGVCKK